VVHVFVDISHPVQKQDFTCPLPRKTLPKILTWSLKQVHEHVSVWLLCTKWWFHLILLMTLQPLHMYQYFHIHTICTVFGLIGQSRWILLCRLGPLNLGDFGPSKRCGDIWAGALTKIAMHRSS
jgi:hypothetical protein